MFTLNIEVQMLVLILIQSAWLILSWWPNLNMVLRIKCGQYVFPSSISMFLGSDYWLKSAKGYACSLFRVSQSRCWYDWLCLSWVLNVMAASSRGCWELVKLWRLIFSAQHLKKKQFVDDLRRAVNPNNCKQSQVPLFEAAVVSCVRMCKASTFIKTADSSNVLFTLVKSVVLDLKVYYHLLPILPAM